MADFLLGQKQILKIPGDIAETYESCKFPEDQRKFLVTWPGIRGRYHTQSC